MPRHAENTKATIGKHLYLAGYRIKFLRATKAHVYLKVHPPKGTEFIIELGAGDLHIKTLTTSSGRV